MAGLTPEQVDAARQRTRANNNVVIYFGIAVGGLMGLFLIPSWLGLLVHRLEQRCGISISRGKSTVAICRSFLLRKIPIFTSLGHLLLFFVYLGINCFLTLWNLDKSDMTNWARRTGWLASLNLALLVFLALKNTPLAILGPYSYERLNKLHQLAAWTTILFAVVHAIIFLFKWIGTTNASILNANPQIFGMVGLGILFISIFVAVVVQTLEYELFYILHVVLFLALITTVGLHQPDITKTILKITIATGGIWFADRILRSLRTLYHAYGTTITVTPLPLGGLRLRLSEKTKLWGSRSGSRVFLWIPSVRPVGMHPFTLVNTNPMELVICPQDGFTRDLRKKALETPGLRLRASIDGPYGSSPDWKSFDEVLLIAGGGGASFSVGVALNLAQHLAHTGNERKTVTLIWVVKDHDYLSWFSRELSELSTFSRVTIRIYITRASSPSLSASSRPLRTLNYPLRENTHKKSNSSSTSTTIVAPMDGKSNSLSTVRTGASTNLGRYPSRTIKAPPPCHAKSASWSNTTPSTPYVTVLSPLPLSHTQNLISLPHHTKSNSLPSSQPISAIVPLVTLPSRSNMTTSESAFQNCHTEPPLSPVSPVSATSPLREQDWNNNHFSFTPSDLNLFKTKALPAIPPRARDYERHDRFSSKDTTIRGSLTLLPPSTQNYIPPYAHAYSKPRLPTIIGSSARLNEFENEERYSTESFPSDYGGFGNDRQHPGYASSVYPADLDVMELQWENHHQQKNESSHVQNETYSGSSNHDPENSQQIQYATHPEDFVKPLTIHTTSRIPPPCPSTASTNPAHNLDIRTGRRPNLLSLIKEFVAKARTTGGSNCRDLGKRETWERVRDREIDALLDGEAEGQEKSGKFGWGRRSGGGKGRGKKRERVMVAVCGPQEMMDVVRGAVAGMVLQEALRGTGKGERSVDLQFWQEEFGW